jgi:hypothetical protein
VTFNVKALGTTPFTYQWRKDGIDIAGETAAVLTLNNAAPQDEGEYSVVVSNVAGNASSNAALLTVLANAPPVAEILTPLPNSTYVAGTSIEFSGSARDAEDGELPASAFQWQVNFHHDSHVHDEPPTAGVKSGTFLIPNEGETSHNVWYKVLLTVTDSKGMTSIDEVDVLPEKSVIALNTNPPGLQLTAEGQPFSTPSDITSVEGVLRTFGAPSPQSLGGVEYEFISWSNDGESTQTIPTPTEDLQLTANFSVIVGTEKNAWDKAENILFPNPTKSEAVTVKISTAQPESISVQMFNFLSQEIVSLSKDLSAGEHLIPFHYGKRARGIYSVIIKTSSDTVVRKLVITD